MPIGVAGFSLGANICLKWLASAASAARRRPSRRRWPWQPPSTWQPSPRNIIEVSPKCTSGIAAKPAPRRAAKDGRDGRRAGLHPLRAAAIDHDLQVRRPHHRVRNGFAGAADYYAKCRCDVLLKHIAVPTLILSAKDDPLVPAHRLPTAADVSDSVALEITKDGGHVGFVSGRRPWAGEVLVGDEDTAVSVNLLLKLAADEFGQLVNARRWIAMRHRGCSAALSILVARATASGTRSQKWRSRHVFVFRQMRGQAWLSSWRGCAPGVVLEMQEKP